MYMESFVNNGKPYPRIVQSVRIAKPDGRKIPQKQVLYNIGPLDRFDDGEPDYVRCVQDHYAHLRKISRFSGLIHPETSRKQHIRFSALEFAVQKTQKSKKYNGQPNY